MRFKKRVLAEAGLSQIDIAPLIDCIFLLFIFFMLMSSFIVIPGISVKLPTVLTSQQLKVQNLNIVLSSEDIIYFNNEPKTLQEIENFVRKGAYDSVFIKADRGSSLGVVMEIWDICKKSGIEKIGIATTYEN